MNHLVGQEAEDTRITVKTVKEKVVNDHRSILEWLREVGRTGDSKRPNKNYKNKNYSILMAKVDSELFLRKVKSTDNTLKDKIIEFISSWYTYASKKFGSLWLKKAGGSNRRKRNH